MLILILIVFFINLNEAKLSTDLYTPFTISFLSNIILMLKPCHHQTSTNLLKLLIILIINSISNHLYRLFHAKAIFQTLFSSVLLLKFSHIFKRSHSIFIFLLAILWLNFLMIRLIKTIWRNHHLTELLI